MGLSHTVSGDIASFRTPSRVPIESLKFHFLPKQASGTPTPANPIPIEGWTSLTGHYANDNIISLSDLQFSNNSSNVDLLITDDTIKIAAKKDGNTWTVSSQEATFMIPKSLRGKSVYFGVDDVILESVNKLDQRSSIVCEFRDENNAFIIDPTVVYVKIGEDNNTYFRTYTIPSNAAKMVIMFRIAQNIAAYGVFVGDYVIYKNFYIRYPGDKHEYTKHEGGSIPITFPTNGKNLVNDETTTLKNWTAKDGHRYISTNTDTRDSVSMYVVQYDSNDVVLKNNVKYTPVVIGRNSLTINVVKGCNKILLKHNGIVRDFGIFIPWDGRVGTYTISANFESIDLLTVGGFIFSDVQIELGDTMTSYELYSSDNTFYGGYIDPVAGEIVKTHVLISKRISDMDNNEIYPGWKNAGVRQYLGSGLNESRLEMVNLGDRYAINTANDNDILFLTKSYYGLTQSEWIEQYPDLIVQFIIQIAEPIHIPITPQAIKAYLNHNNFWSDANDITEVTYAVAESKDILDARKKAFATDTYNHGTLVFELNGDDAPVDGAWVDRISNKAFILNSAASYDSVNKIYDFSDRGAAYYQFYNNDKPVIYLGHHFRIEWDIYFRREGSTNGHFFDIASLTRADKAIGIGLLGKNASAISFNWKMQGNSSNPFMSTGEIRSHPNAPVSGDTNYTHFTGFHEIMNGGDGYDRLRIKIGNRIIQYQTQIPQVEYGPLWQSSYRYIAVGAGVYNGGKEVSAYDTDYLCDVKIRSIKIYILD